jgi:small subunit ribosomal protein S9
MADTKTLEDLKNVIEGADTVAPITDSAVLPEPKIDDLGRAYATGKRKKFNSACMD